VRGEHYEQIHAYPVGVVLSRSDLLRMDRSLVGGLQVQEAEEGIQGSTPTPSPHEKGRTEEEVIILRGCQICGKLYGCTQREVRGCEDCDKSVSCDLRLNFALLVDYRMCDECFPTAWEAPPIHSDEDVA